VGEGLAELLGALLVGPHPVGRPVDRHQRNAKLQLIVALATAEPVPGLYAHPDHRRRLRRPAPLPTGLSAVLAR
jgi:hypothetical protein